MTLENSQPKQGDRRHPHLTAAKTFRLRILQTTDIHANICSFDYYKDRQDHSQGLWALSGLIDEARNEVENCVTFDTGDFLSGTPFGDSAIQDFKDTPNPVVAAMNIIGYDAVVAGNHDFEYGIDVLRKAASFAKFPVMCSNATVLSGNDFFQKAVLMPVDIGTPINIGLIASTPEKTSDWCKKALNGDVDFNPVVPCLKKQAARLREEGADIVIALAHSGIRASSPHDNENQALAIAGIEGVDIVLCAHQHRHFPGSDFEGIEGVDVTGATLHGKPAMMPGSNGSCLGIMDLSLELSDDGWKITSHETTLRNPSIATLTPTQIRLQESLCDWHDKTRETTTRVIGKTSVPLETYFYCVTSENATRTVAEIQAAHVTDALIQTEYSDLPILSAASAFKTGGRNGPTHFSDIPCGPLQWRHICDLYPFPNFIAAALMSGSQIMRWLEKSAAFFHQIAPGQMDADLTRWDVPGFEFDTIYGLNYEIDLSKPAGGRICNLLYNHTAVKPEDQFVVVTNNYRLNGDLKGFDAKEIYNSNSTAAGIIADYLGQKSISFRHSPVWTFSEVKGASAVFDTGPHSVAHIPDHLKSRLDIVGPTKGGFLRYRIHLGTPPCASAS